MYTGPSASVAGGRREREEWEWRVDGVAYGVWEHVLRLVMVCSALAVGPLGLLFLV